MKYTLSADEPLNVAYCLESGQVFRWQKNGDVWTGVIKGKVCKIQQNGKTLTYTGFTHEELRDYFGLNLRFSEVERSFSQPEVKHLLDRYTGLRILHQDLYECILTFLLATNTSIRRIKKMIEVLSVTYGEKIKSGSEIYYSFPLPENIVREPASISKCKLGFREERVVEFAKQVLDGTVNLEKISLMNYRNARNALMNIWGVGQKVADCVCLFALKHYNSFPVDTHIRKWFARQRYMELKDIYPKLGDKGHLSKKLYERIGEFAVRRFGKYAGYVQQYIYLEELDKYKPQPYNPSLQR